MASVETLRPHAAFVAELVSGMATEPVGRSKFARGRDVWYGQALRPVRPGEEDADRKALIAHHIEECNKTIDILKKQVATLNKLMKDGGEGQLAIVRVKDGKKWAPQKFPCIIRGGGCGTTVTEIAVEVTYTPPSRGKTIPQSRCASAHRVVTVLSCHRAAHRTARCACR